MKEIVKLEWRKLGFYYDLDNVEKRWNLIGSKTGLEQFCLQIVDLIEITEKKKIFEHDHLGPYCYLKIMSWKKSVINDKYIAGTCADLKNLVSIIRKKLKEKMAGDFFNISKEFTQDCDYCMKFQIKEEGFDPAIPDFQLWED